MAAVSVKRSIVDPSEILLSCNIIGQLKTNIETNLRFQMVFCFVIVSTLEFLLLCVTWHLHSGL